MSCREEATGVPEVQVNLPCARWPVSPARRRHEQIVIPVVVDITRAGDCSPELISCRTPLGRPAG